MPNMGKGKRKEQPRHGNPHQTMGIAHGKGESPPIVIGNVQPKGPTP